MLRQFSILATFGLLVVPAAALADGATGGAAAPDASGGTTVGQPSSVSAAPGLKLLIAPAAPATGAQVTFTVPAAGGASASSARRVKARIDLVPLGTRRAVARVRFTVAAARTSRVRWTARNVPAGTYGARLNLSRLGVVARTRLTITAPAPAPTATPVPTPTATPAPTPTVPSGRQLTSLSPGIFPVQGAYGFGGEGSRFGAGRTGHIHQGQDVAAASGTPVVAPMAGTIRKTAFQAVGAGYYVVMHGVDGRDYVFMHLLEGSTAVAAGQAVSQGARIGSVGMTGGTSSGPHLHFEIWPVGWYTSTAAYPADPLPQLRAWAGLG